MSEEITITNPTLSTEKAVVPIDKTTTFFGIKLPSFFKNDKTTAKKSVQLSKIANFIYPITILVIIIGMGWFVFFLYNNVYQTMSSAETVNKLRANVSSVSLEKDKFNTIIVQLQQKLLIGSWQAPANISNPFEYGERTNLATTPIVTTTPIIAPITASSTTTTKKTTTSQATSTR